ncbi:MAG TPA: sulfurtransferase [Chloroflexota bacterium]|nr:sulfurtransferase [Chloroflexota bacterium]
MATYANPDALVDTEWVAQHAKDPHVKLVEVDVDTSAYRQGHVPGAIGWNWSTQLEDQTRRDIPTKEDWEKLLSQSGISNDDTIIFYGDNHNWFAAFAYWIAKMYGHKNVKLMNGGRKKWELEKRDLVTEEPKVTPSQYKVQSVDMSLRALQPDVKAHIGKSGAALVDVRSPAEFTGEVLAPPGLQETAQRGGHVPTATNIPWLQAVNEADGTFKSPDELRQRYERDGITPDKDVIAYCRIGERSSHTWFALKELLGYPKVRNYDGSWTEWGSMIGVPIEK